MEREDLEVDSVTDFRVAFSDEEYAEDDVADVGLAAGSVAIFVAGLVLGAIGRTPAKYAGRIRLAGGIGCYKVALSTGFPAGFIAKSPTTAGADGHYQLSARVGPRARVAEHVVPSADFISAGVPLFVPPRHRE